MQQDHTDGLFTDGMSSILHHKAMADARHKPAGAEYPTSQHAAHQASVQSPKNIEPAWTLSMQAP
jgi:hypothetical protein